MGAFFVLLSRRLPDKAYRHLQARCSRRGPSQPKTLRLSTSTPPLHPSRSPSSSKKDGGVSAATTAAEATTTTTGTHAVSPPRAAADAAKTALLTSRILFTAEGVPTEKVAEGGGGTGTAAGVSAEGGKTCPRERDHLPWGGIWRNSSARWDWGVGGASRRRRVPLGFENLRERYRAMLATRRALADSTPALTPSSGGPCRALGTNRTRKVTSG